MFKKVFLLITEIFTVRKYTSHILNIHLCYYQFFSKCALLQSFCFYGWRFGLLKCAFSNSTTLKSLCLIGYLHMSLLFYLSQWNIVCTDFCWTNRRHFHIKIQFIYVQMLASYLEIIACLEPYSFLKDFVSNRKKFYGIVI